jgi:hypothetical protein
MLQLLQHMRLHTSVRKMEQNFSLMLSNTEDEIWGFHGDSYKDDCLLECSTVAITLITEAVRSSETSVDIYQTTRRYIPEDSHLQTQKTFRGSVVFCCEREISFVAWNKLKLNRMKFYSPRARTRWGMHSWRIGSTAAPDSGWSSWLWSWGSVCPLCSETDSVARALTSCNKIIGGLGQLCVHSYDNGIATPIKSYKDQSVKTVQKNDRCFFWESHETHKYTLWTKCRVIHC